MRNRLFLLLLLCFVASCRGQREDIAPDGGGVVFSAESPNLWPGRATFGGWSADDEIGVSMVRQSGPGFWETVVDGAFNRVYSTSGDGVFRPASPDQIIERPLDGQNVTFVAYYPYNGSLAQSPSVLYPINTADQSSPRGLDVMVARNLQDVAVDNSVKQLHFERLNSKIKINLSCEFEQSQMVGVDVSINGVEYEGGSYRLFGQSVALCDLVKSSGELSTRVSSDGKTAEAIVLSSPNFLAQGDLFIFTLKNGRKLTYTHPARIDLSPGVQYLFNIELKANGQAELLTDVVLNTVWDTPFSMEVGEGVLPEAIIGEELSTVDKELYYFRTKLSPEGQKLYDYMAKTLMNYTESEMFLDFTYQIPASINISRTEFEAIASILDYDQPSLYHCYGIKSWAESDGFVRSFRARFSRGRLEYERQYKEILRGADQVMAGITPQMSEYERVRHIHDKFLPLIAYGTSKANQGNIYGALGNFLAVCQGYAQGFQYLLYRAGIQVAYLPANVDNTDDGIMNLLHAWCIVRVDGQYYHVDPTWDDAGYPGPYFRHTYFLKSDATMSRNHEIKAGYPLCPVDYPLP